MTAGLSIAVLGGIVALWLYTRVRRQRQRLIPPICYPNARWDGVAVASGFVIFILSAHFGQMILISLGFFKWLYGADFPTEVGPDPTPAQQAAMTIRHLWASIITFPFQLALITAIVNQRGGPNPLSFRNTAPNMVSGYLTWLLVTPAAFSVFAVANILHTSLTNRQPDRHPLTQLGEHAGNIEWTLFVAQTVFIAPMLEELIFRGILLPWLCQKKAAVPDSPFVVIPRHRSPLILGLAIVVALLFHSDEVRKAIEHREWGTMFAHLIPGAFFFALIPLYWLLPRLRKLHRHLKIRSPRHVQGILASSALFAAFHASVWPSPVPLMVLAVAIGYVSVRTQSLIGPVVVHSLFNAVSASMLLLGATG